MKGKTRRRGLHLIAAIAALAAVSLTAMAVVAAAKDRNDDGIPDRWERKHHLSLKHNQAKRDQDSDELRNRGEFRSGTDPRDADSDGDGVEDGDEGAGKISSFDPETGKLVINLFNGESVSGTVTDDTEIECESDDADEPDEDSPDDQDSERRSEGGDDGPGEGEHGDDGPGEGDEHGDDGPGEGDDDDHGDDDEGEEGHHGDDDDCDGSRCSVDDLTERRVVREASLDVTSEGLVYDEIELG